MLLHERPISYNERDDSRENRENSNHDEVPKKWGLGIQASTASSVILVTVFLAEVVPLYVLPESLGHIGWGDLLSFLPTEYSGEMLV